MVDEAERFFNLARWGIFPQLRSYLWKNMIVRSWKFYHRRIFRRGSLCYIL